MQEEATPVQCLQLSASETNLAPNPPFTCLLLSSLEGSEHMQGHKEGGKHAALQIASNNRAWEDPGGFHTKSETKSAGRQANETTFIFSLCHQ